jgi:5-methylthioadenosine/S-adenosylhomocysteine deaminase
MRSTRFSFAILLSILAIGAQNCASGQQNNAAQRTVTAVDWIWTAGYIATGSADTAFPDNGVIRNGALAIRGNRIVAVGPRATIEASYRAPNHLDQPNAILAPGLINTHTHAAMSLLRGVANDRKLEDWLQNFIFPAEAKNVDREFVRWGTRLGVLEMALSGTTTFTDMYYFEDTVAEVTKQAGLRGVLGQTIIGFPAPDHKTPQEALDAADKFLAAYNDDPLITPAVAPHAIYTTPDDVLKASRALADKYHKPFIIHLAETKTEYDDSRKQRMMTPVEALVNLNALIGWTIAAHCVWLDDTDIGLLAAYQVGVAHNPSSNMMLASGVAPIPKLLARGVNVGLGTDGPAGSNNDFDMFEEMDLAAKLQKVSTGDPASLSARQVFTMATLGGASALNMQNVIGSLEVGKMADVISVRLDSPRAAPIYDVYAALVYALKGSDVGDVMVNGKMIVRDRKMLTLDSTSIMAKAAEYHDQVVASLKPQR